MMHCRPADAAAPPVAAAKRPRPDAGGVRAMDDDDMFRAKLPALAPGPGGIPASMKKVCCTSLRLIHSAAGSVSYSRWHLLCANLLSRMCGPFASARTNAVTDGFFSEVHQRRMHATAPRLCPAEQMLMRRSAFWKWTRGCKRAGTPCPHVLEADRREASLVPLHHCLPTRHLPGPQARRRQVWHHSPCCQPRGKHSS